MIIGWHHVFFRLSTMIPIQHQPHQPSLDGGFPGLGPLLHMDAALSDELLSSATAVSVSSLENNLQIGDCARHV